MEDIEKRITMIKKLDVSSFVPLKVKIIRQMNDDKIYRFSGKLHSFIKKWTR